MQQLRRFWFAFAIVFLLLGIVLGGWLLGVFSSSQTLDAHRSLVGVASAVPSVEASPTALSHTLLPGARLVAPSIGVDALIEPVGMLPDGAMAVPTQNPWTGVGWYSYGPMPGERGSAVIDGHLDRPGGAPAVFWRLRYLKVGDIISVVNGNLTQRFRVNVLNYYRPDNAPTRQIFMNQVGTFLNLITCAGVWVPSEHQTTLRLVVYTTLL